MPLPDIWPVFNFINIVLLDENESKSVNDTNKYKWYYELIVRHLRLSTYLIVSYMIYYFTFPSYNALLIPLSSTPIQWWFKWFLIILIRDQSITYLFYSSWHYLLYISSYSSKMAKLKFNPQYPSQSQWDHDKFYTLYSGTVISSFFELFMIYFYKLYPQTLLYNMSDNINISYFDYIFIIFWLLFIPYWRDFHFYFIHRLIHPWNINIIGTNIDIGEYLYKSVHSLHHKSYNTGPWSGLSMHPVEHLLYYSCMLFPSLIMFNKQHPIHMLFNKYHAQLSPLPGHDGFDSPGGGSYFHYLHHAHFECNYGTPMIPLDKLFNSFEDGQKYRKNKQYDSVNKHKD